MTKKLITELTPAQQREMEETREYWRRVGCSCEPADKPRAEAAIAKLYKLQLDKPAPQFLWFPSPFACMKAINVLQNSDVKLEDLKNDLFVTDLVEKSDVKTKFVDGASWGSQEAYWIAFYKFCESIGVKYNKKQSQLLDQWAEIAHSCLWWWAFDSVCVISDRPKFVSFDEQNRLHHDTQKAIEFRDGYGVASVHGVRVPAWIIETPEKITLKDIDDQENAEIRRIMTDKYGVGRYLHDTGAEVIDFEMVPVERHVQGGRSVPRALLRDKFGRQFLEGTDGSTNRCYFMPVPDDAKTCSEAHSRIMPFGDDSNVKAQS